MPPEHPARRQVEEGSAAAHAAMPSVKLPLPAREHPAAKGSDKCLVCNRPRSEHINGQLCTRWDEAVKSAARRRPLRIAPAIREVVRARSYFGWWVKTWVDRKAGDPITEVWFLTKRGADRYASR